MLCPRYIFEWKQFNSLISFKYFDVMSFLVAFHNYSNGNSFVKNTAISANTCARKVLVVLKVEIKNGANYEASDALKPEQSGQNFSYPHKQSMRSIRSEHKNRESAISRFSHIPKVTYPLERLSVGWNC